MSYRHSYNKKEKSLYDLNFNYDGVESDYEYYHPCANGSDCCDGNYCRCGEIINTEIKSVDFERVLKAVISYFNYSSMMDLYAVDRILRHYKMYETSAYEVKVCGGYYGEEIDGVRFSDVTKLEQCFAEYAGLTTEQEQVEFLLKLEYGYLLEAAQDKVWSIKEIKIALINKGNDDYYRKLGTQDGGLYTNYSLPKCVVIARSDDFRLIDGYHRMVDNKDEVVTAIVGV